MKSIRSEGPGLVCMFVYAIGGGSVNNIFYYKLSNALRGSKEGTIYLNRKIGFFYNQRQ